jgi:hypothetical protein
MRFLPISDTAGPGLTRVGEHVVHLELYKTLETREINHGTETRSRKMAILAGNY